MKQSTVLITGATGLLGRQILFKLLGTEYQVYAVKRAHSTIPIESENLHWIEVNSINDDLFRLVPSQVDYVIHAAALVSYKKSDSSKLFKINRDWTSKLAQDAKKEGVKKFVFISSISALGKNATNNVIDENTPKSDREFLSNYGKSKRQAEEALWKFSSEGLPITIFNPSVIIGPANRYQSSAQLLGYVSDQKPFFTKGLINYIDVRDVAKIVVESLANNRINEQFVLNAGSISYKDFFSTVAKQLNVKAPSIGVPKFMVVFGAALENILSKISGNPAVLTMETAKMAGNKNIYNAKKANKAFNISYTTLEQSVQWTVKEMQKRGEL
ncbi:NAD-dependent epimerase [Marivirga tractuosa]|uniref:NAD-dependent epimerase/dehydratase n=1 Tax=Marivirga tractuosa (strain ATCC 23168 / DSM 4126 / NBRC 15989 / NCIMB 1408 / VKM B-1430 / H-43) TaxID=643867 RepID=E4TQD1_MARTH|nr:NAD-dependent epimerase/dehydratase family protein [Marivirga tractuosa]ADR22654.1 NAD-dependent epimerase/dehydratase [Marivirga tractuosa DSM 4126]BDD16675.1 NAD-dependent epimerase [Marivirga tractuosa]